jgi:wobble nucleotide-excising tRNase
LIYEFQQAPKDVFTSLHYLPNIVRRFVETYLNFKYLAATSIEDNISDLIVDNIDCEKARKFIHYYSHNLTTDSFMKIPNLVCY